MSLGGVKIKYKVQNNKALKNFVSNRYLTVLKLTFNLLADVRYSLRTRTQWCKSYSTFYLSSASHKTYLLYWSIFDCLLRHARKRAIYVQFVVLICLKKNSKYKWAALCFH